MVTGGSPGAEKARLLQVGLHVSRGGEVGGERLGVLAATRLLLDRLLDYAAAALGRHRSRASVCTKREERFSALADGLITLDGQEIPSNGLFLIINIIRVSDSFVLIRMLCFVFMNAALAISAI
jgi:hypothetical protein